jgi:hypothetical protein
MQTLVPAVTFEQLRRKSRVMLAMRIAHQAGDDDPAQVRVQMAELASAFPGALREIDQLELRAIEARIADLDAVVRGEAAAARWMEAVALFHALARGALEAKRWLAGRKRVDAAATAEFMQHAARLDPESAAAALAWAHDLGQVAAPPRGRVMDLVFTRVAGALGASDSEARALVFGASLGEEEPLEDERGMA